MTNDPIVAEVRAIREQIAKECDFDLRRIIELARERQASSWRRIVAMRRERLAHECAKSDRKAEQQLAEEGLTERYHAQPAYRGATHTEGRHYVGGPGPAQRHKQGGGRPVAILSDEVFNQRSGTSRRP